MNYTRTTTAVHVHGDVTTEAKVFGHGNDVIGTIYGRAQVSAGASEVTFYIETSEQAQAIASLFGGMANDLAIAEVERDNAQAAAEQAAAEQDRAQRGAPRRICCESREDEDHQPECGRPLYHTPRADLLAMVHGGDAEAKREWDIREGEQAATFARSEDHPQRASYATDAQ